MSHPHEGTLPVRVAQVRWEADGVLSLLLADPNGAQLPPWAPGAHIDVRLPSGLIRQYSLCGDPDDRSSYRIAVRLEESGRGGSAEIHTTALTGRVLQITQPRNRFPLREAVEHLFIAGGIGITPLLPMAAHVEATIAGNWSAVYCGRGLSTMPFVSELTYLSPSKAIVIDTSAEGRPDLDDRIGQLQPGSVVYCCGPARLIDTVGQICESHGIDFVSERFGADQSAATSGEPGSSGPFDVELARTGGTVTVPEGRSIIEALRDAGIEVDSSCEEGYCGTCEVSVLDGMPDHRDTVLSRHEREANKCMMMCVSRACSTSLVLDL